MVRPDDAVQRLEIDDEARALYLHLVGGGTVEPDGKRAAGRLLSLGLLRRDEGQEPEFTPVDPRYVGAQWEAAFHAYATAMLEQAADVPNLLRELSTAYDHRATDPRAGVMECIRGSDAIGARLGQMFSSSTEELLFCQPGRERRVEVMNEARERDLSTLRRGISMRTLYHADVRAGAAMNGWVREMAGAGAEFRTLDEDFQRMFIIDRRIAVIPGDSILTTSNEAVAYVVHDRGVAGFLAQIFERDWARADTWERPTGRAQLTDRHRIVLRELEAEKSVDDIAKQLKVSKRTAASLVAEIKEIFGVTTLFGLACAWKAYESSH